MTRQLGSVLWIGNAMLRGAVHPRFPDYKIFENGIVIRTRKARQFEPGHILRGRILVSGYRQFKLRDWRGKIVFIRGGRLLLEALVGPASTKPHQAAHLDGNRSNDRLSNLQWKTPKENSADKLIHGTHGRGSNSGMARLDDKKVAAIREQFTSRKGDIKRLAKQYGVGRTTIGNVVYGRTWQSPDFVPPPTILKRGVAA